MVSIGICDDERTLCRQLEEQLFAVCEKKSIQCDIDLFYDGESLCNSLKAGDQYDLLLLDIELIRLSGVEVGKYIREELSDIYTQIVYISRKESYAMELFSVQPMDFLIKPVSSEQLENIMEKVLVRIGVMKKRFLYKQKGKSYFAELQEILYFRSENRKIHMYLRSGHQQFYGRLEQIYRQLPRKEFLWIHKSYLVNAEFVKSFGYEQVKLYNNEILPISQSRRKKIRLAQSRLFFERENV